MKSKALLTLLLLVVIGATIGLFFLFSTCETRDMIFYANISIAVISEIVIFTSLATVSFGSQNNTQTIAVANQLIRGASLLLLTVVIYSVLKGLNIPFINNTIYFAILIVIAAIFSTLAIVTSIGGSQQIKTNEAIKQRVAEKKLRTIQVDSLIIEFRNATKNKDIDAVELVAVTKQINSTIAKFKTIPAYFFTSNENEVITLESKVNELKALIDSIYSTSDIGTINEEISSICRDISNKVDLFKKL